MKLSRYARKNLIIAVSITAVVAVSGAYAVQAFLGQSIANTIVSGFQIEQNKAMYENWAAKPGHTELLEAPILDTPEWRAYVQKRHDEVAALVKLGQGETLRGLEQIVWLPGLRETYSQRIRGAYTGWLSSSSWGPNINAVVIASVPCQEREKGATDAEARAAAAKLNDSKNFAIPDATFEALVDYGLAHCLPDAK